MLGASARALRRGHRQRGELAVLNLRQGRIEIVEQDLDIAGKGCLQRRAGAAERHMDHLQSRQLQEPGAGEVGALPDAGGAVGQLVRIGLDIGDEVADRLDRHRRMGRYDVRNPDQVGDRLQLIRLVGHVAENAVGDGVGAGIADQDGVPVALLAHDLRRADGAAAAGAVLHDRGLAPRLLQMCRQQPPHHIGGASRRGRHDQADGFGRPPVGAEARARQDRCGGNGGGSGQYTASRKGSGGHRFTPCWDCWFGRSVGSACATGKRRLGAGFPRPCEPRLKMLS